MTKNFEIENIDRVHDAIDAMLSRRVEYERAVKAEMVAFIMRAYCPEGQDVSYEALKKLYQELRRGIE